MYTVQYTLMPVLKCGGDGVYQSRMCVGYIGIYMNQMLLIRIPLYVCVGGGGGAYKEGVADLATVAWTPDGDRLVVVGGGGVDCRYT